VPYVVDKPVEVNRNLVLVILSKLAIFKSWLQR